MANKYFVWKDPNCNGINPEWIEMNGKAFYEFTKHPANKYRYFVRLGNDVCEEADVIFIEANKNKYDEWNREESARYRREKDRIEHPYKIVSLDDKASELHELTFNEVVPDESVNVEQEVISKLHYESVRKIVMDLPLEERHIIEVMYYGPELISERAAAIIFGIPRKTLNNRKIKIFEKIKKSLAQN